MRNLYPNQRRQQGIQLAHTKKVINFFKTRLFTPKKSDWSIIDIHPNLLDGDIKVLEQVSKDARELLIEYYKNCEDKYQLRQKEGEYIRQIGTLNKYIAGRSDKEYDLETKDKKVNINENILK